METAKKRTIKKAIKIKKIAKQILGDLSHDLTHTEKAFIKELITTKKRGIKIEKIAKQILRDLSHTDKDCIKEEIIKTGLWKILNYEYKLKEEENER